MMHYHYTSIDSLVQIVSNRSIKFNSLVNCDDIDEAESADMGLIGKYVYVSCWTRDASESIPMWSQYSGNMHGVRIGMQEYPFDYKTYVFGDSGSPFKT